MMLRVLFFTIIGLLIAFAASWLSQQSGITSITWLGYQMELETSYLVVGIAGFGILLILIDRMVRALFRWPSLFSAGWQARRRAKGEKALSLGFVALAAGDSGAAAKQARRAEKLLEKGILTDLLSAQSAYARGDSKAASRYFKKLAADETTSYFGQLGLMRLYQQDSGGSNVRGQNISPKALGAAQKAFALDPTSSEAAYFILQQALKDKQWGKATDCLSVYLNQSGGQNAGEIAKAKTMMASLLTQMAEDEDDSKAAIAHLEQALSILPSFSPAISALTARYLAISDKRKAVKIAEKGFLLVPQPLSLAALRDAKSGNDGSFISYAAKLAEKSAQPDHAYREIARFAIQAGIWASASQMLEHISPETPRTNDDYRIAAAIASGVEDEAAYQSALEAAAQAPRASRWQCQACHSDRPDYEFECGHCTAPAQIHWHQPVPTSQPPHLPH